MTHGTMKLRVTLAALFLLPPLASAMAHTGAGAHSGFASGFMHPISGLDHLVAMVAVGLWGAQLGNRAIWVLPITFPIVMALGGLLGISGIDIPLTEFMIALSGLSLGLAVALRARPPLWTAAILIGAFAIFHGYAHGRELPEAPHPLAYGAGFVIATSLLHLSGILMGLLIRWPSGALAIRAGGVAIGCVGAYFLIGALGTIA